VSYQADVLQGVRYQADMLQEPVPGVWVWRDMHRVAGGEEQAQNSVLVLGEMQSVRAEGQSFNACGCVLSCASHHRRDCRGRQQPEQEQKVEAEERAGAGSRRTRDLRGAGLAPGP
jgi:hypothetical protein